MLRTRVSSSDLQSVGYDAPTCTLEIKFHSGGIYQYFKVPETIYRAIRLS
ncbi:KTSC domain-containing protein [Nostoc sp.]